MYLLLKSASCNIAVLSFCMFPTSLKIYSWSELKSFITPEIDEGKGFTIQKSYSADGGSWNIGRALIVNNVAYGNGFSGIHLNIVDRVDIFSNTVYQNSRTGRGNNVGISLSDAKDVRVINNIAAAQTSWGGFALSAANARDCIFTTNLVYGLISNDVQALDDSGPTLFGDPLFNNPQTFDFRLTAASPARNMASTSYLPVNDFSNSSRASQADIGAFNYQPPSEGRSSHSYMWHASLVINNTHGSIYYCNT
jgi:parallel beta-helix repeat protein